MVQADKVVELDTALAIWRDSIPMEYRPGQEILAPREIYQSIAMLHLQHFNLLRAMYCTLLVSARQSGFALISHPNPRIRTTEAVCAASARSFVKVLNE